MNILKDFLGKKCLACGGWKDSNRSFCTKCYRSLPKEMQTDLWKRFGEGYEQAFAAAASWLKTRGVQTDLFSEGSR